MTRKIQHEMLVIAIALIALFMIASTASADAHEVNTLRIYGENGYSAAFPYTDPEAPFDPMNNESPMKDFVTFNPALIEEAVVVDNYDSKQKVFARQWFVPEYTEPTGMVWIDDFECQIVCDGQNPSTQLITDGDHELLKLPPGCEWGCEWIPSESALRNEVSQDIVTEYTYMLINEQYQPIAATTKSDTRAYWTKFWFPVSDMDDQIGLDSYDIDYDTDGDMVVLEKVGDFNRDGHKDIQIRSQLLEVEVGGKVQFLDHIAEIVDVTRNEDGEIAKVMVNVQYNGNKDILPEDELGMESIDVETGTLTAGRHTMLTGEYNRPQFYEPWFLEVDSTSDNSVFLYVGRQLYEGETFFVDGAEYDVARIFGPSENDIGRGIGPCTWNNDVKYITIRNPVPEDNDVDLEDLSVVKKAVSANEIIPMLPPFNMEHTMVDDINIPVSGVSPCGDDAYDTYYVHDFDTVKERRVENVGPLNIYFTKHDTEERFHTSLLEILDEHGYVNPDDAEYWKWLHIRTMPDFYKDFVYPELPEANLRGIENGDFLVTSSWRAPNSDFCGKTICPDDGEIVLPQRLMFVYDQVEGATDLYINEIDTETNGLRIYGEDGLSANFPYETTRGPFDPFSWEAPEKDFVTINPAKIKAGIVVDNHDSKEKVFFRQWFVPEYKEPTGMVWIDDFECTIVKDGVESVETIDRSDNELLRKPPGFEWECDWVPSKSPLRNKISEDIVNEYTYMFINEMYQPTPATTRSSNTGSYWTWFWFPVSGMDENQIGLDSFDIDYDGIDDRVVLEKVGDFNRDNHRDIQIRSQLLEVGVGEKVQFLDHIATIVSVTRDGDGQIAKVIVKLQYNGNKEILPEDELGLWTLDVETGTLTAGRHTVLTGEWNRPQFYEPWFLEIDSTTDDNVYLYVGRQLYERETFFVDGAEYDVAQIYGPSECDLGRGIGPCEPIDCDVKYITIRNPIPEDYDVDLEDLSVVKKAVSAGDVIPVLPPFNGDYTMIDDIDIAHSIPSGEDMTCYYGQDTDYTDMWIASGYDSIPNREVDTSALEIKFTEMSYEDRFNTNLMEILNEGCCISTSADSVEECESWKWLHIRTMPDCYKEFIYPDVPDMAGDGDYLLTSSFLAPNSVLCQKPDVMQRLVFTHDPTDGTGIYMNGGAVPIAPPSEMKGDVNGDDSVNILDFGPFAAAYDSAVGDANYNVVFDFDDDGDVDIIDFGMFAGVYEF